MTHTRRVLGVDFFVGDLETGVDRALAGGLVVAPSGPGLAVDLVVAPDYREALTTADVALTDSGWMVLLWLFFTGEKLPRHSGLKFIRAVLARPELKKEGAVFWVMPSEDAAKKNVAWLRSVGFAVNDADVYVAPYYPATGPVVDETLRARIAARRAPVVMLAVGGGVQERLGLSLRAGLEHRPTILCLGAAIAFLSGVQNPIPQWADKLMLGWLFRLVAGPRSFWKRLWKALGLMSLVWRYRDAVPVPAHSPDRC